MPPHYCSSLIPRYHWERVTLNWSVSLSPPPEPRYAFLWSSGHREHPSCVLRSDESKLSERRVRANLGLSVKVQAVAGFARNEDEISRGRCHCSCLHPKRPSEPLQWKKGRFCSYLSKLGVAERRKDLGDPLLILQVSTLVSSRLKRHAPHLSCKKETEDWKRDLFQNEHYNQQRNQHVTVVGF